MSGLRIPLNFIGDSGTYLRFKQSGSTDIKIGVAPDNGLIFYDAAYPDGIKLEDILIGAIEGGTFLPSVRGSLKWDVGLTRPTSIMRVADGSGHLIDIGSGAGTGNIYRILPITGSPQSTSINLYINGMLQTESSTYLSFTGFYNSGLWHIETAPSSGVYIDTWGVRFLESSAIYSSSYMLTYDKKIWDTLGLTVSRRNTVSYTFPGTLPVEVSGYIEHIFVFPAPTPPTPITDPDSPFNWQLPDFVELGDFDFYRNGLKEGSDRLHSVLAEYDGTTSYNIRVRIINDGSYLSPTDTITFSYPFLYTY